MAFSYTSVCQGEITFSLAYAPSIPLNGGNNQRNSNRSGDFILWQEYEKTAKKERFSVIFNIKPKLFASFFERL